MAVLEILKYPDTRLRIKAKPIISIDENLLKMVNDMYETMYAAKGVGLAGTQVNIHQQIFTMDVSENHAEPMCILNPEIVEKSGMRYEEEGCLSVGSSNIYDKVERSLYVKLRYMDLNGKTQELTAEGLMAVCIQHEVDHLNGKLFIDHLSKLKQDRIRKKIEKYK